MAADDLPEIGEDLSDARVHAHPVSFSCLILPDSIVPIDRLNGPVLAQARPCISGNIEHTSYIAEGFGLTPELLAPVLTSSRHAVWLVPTEAFKLASMQQRGKGRFDGQVRDAFRAFHNLLKRDRLLTERIRKDAARHHFNLIEIDGSESVEAVATRVADHFGDLD